MKEYKVGGWRAVLLSVRVINSYRSGTIRHLKSREFAVRKVSDPRLFCTVSVPDRDGSHEDTELLQVLAALDAYRGEDESMSVIANEGCMTRSAPAN